MMKSIKKVGILTLPFVLILICLLFVSGLYAYPENIEFSGNKNRGMVAFPHEIHMEELACLDCHHIMENGQNILDESDLEEGSPDILCFSCHNSQSKIKKIEAFHSQCMGCHDSYSLTSQKTGPTLCGECHILKK